MVKILHEFMYLIYTTLKLFKCDQPNCDFASPRKANLKKHLLGTHLAKGQVKVDLVCKVCNEVFPASNKKADNLYYKHYREKHNDLPPEYKGYSFLECPQNTDFSKVIKIPGTGAPPLTRFSYNTVFYLTRAFFNVQFFHLVLNHSSFNTVFL